MKDQNSLCHKLHLICGGAKKFDLISGFSNLPKNGIYLLFEMGEEGHGTQRIVRVGTHTGEGGLRSRIRQHFSVPNKNRSIFRKNIGRCMLNRDQDPYLKIWDYAIRSKEAERVLGPEIDREKEKELEAAITDHIGRNFSVAVIRCDEREERLRLESRIISTVSNCTQCKASKEWFGNDSTREKIRKGGLWQVNELYKENLSLSDLEYIRKNVVR